MLDHLWSLHAREKQSSKLDSTKADYVAEAGIRGKSFAGMAAQGRYWLVTLLQRAAARCDIRLRRYKTASRLTPLLQKRCHAALVGARHAREAFVDPLAVRKSIAGMARSYNRPVNEYSGSSTHSYSLRRHRGL